MGTISGGRLVARMLRREGVDTVFTLSGLHVAPIYAGCVDEGVRLVDTRHEQAAAHAADAWARLTRGVGVCVVTAGPGVTGTVTAVANAWAAGVPLLVLGGAAPTFNQGRGALQEMPQTQLFAGITKWSDRVPSPEHVPGFLARAFRVARAGRPGPVFLEIPWDVLSNGADEALADAATGLPHRGAKPRRPGAARRGGGAAGAGGAAGGAGRLVDLVGRRGRCAGALRRGDRGAGAPQRDGPRLPAPRPPAPSSRRRARRRWGAPTWCWWWARRSTSAWATGCRPPSPRTHGWCRWTSTRPRLAATGRSRWASSATRGACSRRCARRPAAPPPAAAAPWVTRAGWRRCARSRRGACARQRAFEESEARPIHHFRLAKAIDRVAGGGDVTYVGDGGNVVAVAAKVLRVPGPGRWLDPGPLGCLGVGAPFAIAARLLAPERPVCVVQGDGAFGLNGMDYETAVRFGLPMVVVVGNDAAWGQIRIPQRAMHGDDHAPATRLAPVRYDRLVEAMGGWGEHVDDPADLEPALERAFASGKVACVDVAIDPEAAAAAGAAGYAV